MILAMHPMLTALSPELALVIGGTVILIVGLALGRQRAGPLARFHGDPRYSSANGSATRGANAILVLALLTVAAALLLTRLISGLELPPVASVRQDSLTWYARLIGLGFGVLILLVNHHVPEQGEKSEFAAMILFSLAGVLLAALANDLVFLFLALELVSIPTYILIGLSRRHMAAQEATAKYFFLGGFAAALTLYGFSFLYGVAGTMRLFPGGAGEGSVSLALSKPGGMGDTIAIVGLMLALTGLTFKIAAVPLHFYAADVYQGAAAPVAGLLGFIPKFAGFIAIVRLLSLTGWNYGGGTFWLLWTLAVATMFVGNTLALMQDNAKRMLAYSSIAHSGYMLVALTAGPGGPASAGEGPMRSGVSALLFYMAVYGVMNLGAFAALAHFRKAGPDGEDSAEMLTDLAGASRRQPWASLALAICTLGLMGFPLTGGFLGKVYVFSAVFSASVPLPHRAAMIALVVLGVINAAIAAAYYLRILAACYVRREAADVTPSPCPVLKLGLALCVIAILAVFFRPGVLLDASQQAARQVVATGSALTTARSEGPAHPQP